MDEPRTIGSSRPHRIREIDFRRPMKFTRDQLRQLEHSHDSFCRSASSRLSAELRTEFQLGFMTSDQLPYSAVMAEEVPRAALVVVLRAEPIGTEVALVMEIDTALQIVTRVLGGKQSIPSGTATGLTELEMAVARRGLTGLVESLSATWSDMCGLTFSIVGGETSPVSVQIVPPSEPTLLLTFQAQLEDDISLMTLVLPYRALEPVIEQIGQSAFGFTFDGEDNAAENMTKALQLVQIPLAAEVGHTSMQVTELLSLKAGDVIRLPQRAQDGMTLRIGDESSYRVTHGVHGSKKAVQVTQALKDFQP